MRLKKEVRYLCHYSKKQTANLRESRPSGLANRIPFPSLTSTRLIVASRMANRHRSAERLTRASGARKWRMKTTESNAKEKLELRAPEARVKHLAERWRLAIRDAARSRVEVSEGNGMRLAKPEGRDSRRLAVCFFE